EVQHLGAFALGLVGEPRRFLRRIRLEIGDFSHPHCRVAAGADAAPSHAATGLQPGCCRVLVLLAPDEFVRTTTMKKLALIGTAVVVGALTCAGTALAKPTAQSPQAPSGMTAAEYDALMARSQGLNDLYGVKPLPAVTLEQGQKQRFSVSQPA